MSDNNGRDWSDTDWIENADPAVLREAQSLRNKQVARQMVAAELDNHGFAFPDLARRFKDDIAEPEREPVFAITDLDPTGGNILLSAQRKSGKTVAMMNLVKALLDGEPFLGEYKVRQLEGTLVYFNYELTKGMFDRWMRGLDLQNKDKLAVIHLRGQLLPFWLPHVRNKMVEYIKGVDGEVAIIDPAARASQGLVVDSRHDSQVTLFTSALDRVKYLSGLHEVYMSHHMAWMPGAEDDEHGSGSWAWEAWMDAGWYMTRDKEGTRYFRAYGRDVDLDAFALDFDKETKTLTHAGQTREDKRDLDYMYKVCVAVSQLDDWSTSSDVSEQIQALDKTQRSRYIKLAEDDGYIERKPGPKGAKLCALTMKGEELLSPKLKLGEDG